MCFQLTYKGKRQSLRLVEDSWRTDACFSMISWKWCNFFYLTGSIRPVQMVFVRHRCLPLGMFECFSSVQRIMDSFQTYLIGVISGCPLAVTIEPALVCWWPLLPQVIDTFDLWAWLRSTWGDRLSSILLCCQIPFKVRKEVWSINLEWWPLSCPIAAWNIIVFCTEPYDSLIYILRVISLL